MNNEKLETENKSLRDALEALAAQTGLTLLGCNCDNYMHCDCGDTAYRAHERGANKAFEQCAATAQAALKAIANELNEVHTSEALLAEAENEVLRDALKSIVGQTDDQFVDGVWREVNSTAKAALKATDNE